MSTSAVIADVLGRLKGEPVFVAGSLVAADTYGIGQWHDVDVFTPTEQAIIACVEKLIGQGYKLDDRFSRVWARWKRMGFNKWHTNSMRLMSPQGIETNVVYKLTEGHPTTSLAQVLESFDFGLLAVGYEAETGQFRDMRSYLFPGHRFSELPMMPNKRDNWRQGFISQYNGLREVGRYVKYHEYGHNLTLVKDDLVTGYWAASLYYHGHPKKDLRPLGLIYETIAKHLEHDNIKELREAANKIDYDDSLDVIMKALE